MFFLKNGWLVLRFDFVNDCWCCGHILDHEGLTTSASCIVVGRNIRFSEQKKTWDCWVLHYRLKRLTSLWAGHILFVFSKKFIETLMRWVLHVATSSMHTKPCLPKERCYRSFDCKEGQAKKCMRMAMRQFVQVERTSIPDFASGPFQCAFGHGKHGYEHGSVAEIIEGSQWNLELKQ